MCVQILLTIFVLKEQINVKRLIYFMYTTTMTVDELINEFTADLPQILSISDAKQKKADQNY